MITQSRSRNITNLSSRELETKKRKRDLMLLRHKLQNAYTINPERLDCDKEDKQSKKMKSLMLAIKSQIEIEMDVRALRHLRLIRLAYSIFEKEDFTHLSCIRAFVSSFLKEYADLSKVYSLVYQHGD